jgi:hypothetical protein
LVLPRLVHPLRVVDRQALLADNGGLALECTNLLYKT